MTLQRLNGITPQPIEARGFMAPYVRIACHIGYCIQWIIATTDENWETTGTLDEISATQIRVKEDLREAVNHLTLNDDINASAFVNIVQTEKMNTLKLQLIELRDALPQSRTDALIELQTLSDNLAYVAAQFELHTTGNMQVSEGRNA
jgi:hypothetical protein